MVFGSVEAAYQWSKFVGNDELRQQIAASDARTSKQLARQHRHLVRKDWEGRKVAVMRHLLALKFVAGSELADMLLATGEQQLIEANSWGDQFWGTCNGVGTNWLGVLLMEQRQQL